VILPPSPVHRREARLSALGAVQQALMEASDLRDLCRTVQRELGRVMETTGFLLGLYDDVSQMVEVVYQLEVGEELAGGSFPLGHGFMSEVIRSRQPRLIRHWSAEGPRVQVQYATGTPGLPEATVTVPMLAGDRVRGVLSVQSYRAGAYDENDLFLVQAIAAQAVSAIDGLQSGAAGHAARRASELEAILASMNEGLLILDQHGRIVSLNPPARRIFGSVGSGIILGQRLDRAQWGEWPLGARAVAEALAPIINALANGEARRDIEVELNSEGRRVLSFSSSPLFDACGKPAGGVVVFRDVTSQRDVARLKDELLSIASHDLRTPVTVMKAQAQLMQRALQRLDQPVEPDKLCERVQLMIDQADRLTRMLNQLLDLSRVEAGRLELNLELVDLSLLVRRVALNVQALSTNHQIHVDGPSSVEGEWDSARLEQVVQNLLTNAVKYAPDGGRVSVSVLANDAEVQVLVRDEGLGIPADELPHIFEQFYRVEGTRKLEGTGLGLYICRGIVASHGGRVWAMSDGPGCGSTFAFSLPRFLTDRHEAVTQ
jgi:two-component system phosphate regulon sensor histidine kinase PhoR